MASIGDDGSDTDSLDDDTSETSSAVIGAENNGIDLEDAQDDPPTRNGDRAASSSGEDEHDSSEESDRENRFEGPSSTWRFYTEEERSLANSLDQQRANDLSIHLYNAHASKARLRDPNAPTIVEPEHSKKQWIKPNEDGTFPWHPSAGWTAWPLRSQDVPRRSERFGVHVLGDGSDDETYRKTEMWKPSRDLEEEILASTLRAAKERLRKANPDDRSATEEDAGQDELRTREDSHVNLDEDSVIDITMAEEDDEVEHSDPSTHPAEPTIYTDENNLLVDDDAARTFLNPSIRHVLSRLDGLLMGLHKSRKGQVRSNSRSRSKTPRSRSTSKAGMSASRSRSRQPNRSKSRKGDENGTLNSDSGDSVGEDDGNNDRPKRRRRLNPRDWSEVLGMAAFTGWDPEVVDRATRRCASLFGEGMKFRTIPLSSVDTTNAELRTYRSGGFPEATTTAVDKFIVQDKPASSRYYCPVSSCSRHEESYDRAWRLYEHVRRSHKYSNPQVERLKTKLRSSEKEAGQQRETKASESDDAVQDGDAMHVDPLLQPIAVKMARGKDKNPRKRKPTQRQAQADEEQDMEL